MANFLLSVSISTIACNVAIVRCGLSHVQLFATPWTVALSGSSVHGIFQARILEWVAISSFKGSSQGSADDSHVSCIGRWVLCHCASMLPLTDMVIFQNKHKDYFLPMQMFYVV